MFHRNILVGLFKDPKVDEEDELDKFADNSVDMDHNPFHQYQSPFAHHQADMLI